MVTYQLAGCRELCVDTPFLHVLFVGWIATLLAAMLNSLTAK